MSTGFVGGSKYHWVATRDNNGYPMGSLATPNSPSQNTLYTPIVRDCGFVQKDEMGIEPSEITWFEGNQICGRLDLGVNDVTAFNTTFASVANEYNDLISGRTETSPLSGVEVGGLNTGEVLLPGMFAGFGVFYKTTTAQKYLTSHYQFMQIREPDIGYGQGDGQNPNTLDYNFSPSESARLMTGDSVGSTYKAYRYVMHWFADDGYMFTETFIGDNAANTFTLTYLPTTTDNTGAATIRVTVNGSTQAVTSISDSTGLVTFASAPAADAIVCVTYPTLFTPSS